MHPSQRRGHFVNYPSKNVLISLEGRHADGIISGTKKVELRNRRMNLSKGDCVWIYRKQPNGRVVMRATVKAVDEGNPQLLWGRYRKVCGISKKEFFAYFGGVKIGCAISLYKIKTLSSSVPLETIRKKETTFHPPQFSKYLPNGTPLLTFLEDCLAVGGYNAAS